MGQEKRWKEERTWQKPSSLGEGSETPDSVTSEGIPEFPVLRDKVWSYEVLFTAWQDVRRNGGTAGTDGTTIAEAQGVGQWLEELARDLKEGTYRPAAVRQVPKKTTRKIPAPGDPLRRVAQTAAMLVADLRSRPATGAVRLQTGKKRTRRGQSGAPVVETRPP